MKARIANLKCCTYLDLFMPIQEGTSWNKDDIRIALDFTKESVARWQDIFKDIDTYTEADQDVTINCVAMRRAYISMFSIIVEKEMMKQRLNILNTAKGFIIRNTPHPYSLIHLMSLC